MGNSRLSVVTQGATKKNKGGSAWDNEIYDWLDEVSCKDKHGVVVAGPLNDSNIPWWWGKHEGV